jgi:hypothetical protein
MPSRRRWKVTGSNTGNLESRYPAREGRSLGFQCFDSMTLEDIRRVAG